MRSILLSIALSQHLSGIAALREDGLLLVCSLAVQVAWMPSEHGRRI